MNEEIKRYLVYFQLALFSVAAWYIAAESVLTFIWNKIWH